MSLNVDPSKIPPEAIGLRLCKMRGDELILCETVVFVNGWAAVERALRLASIGGHVGPIGDTGDFWADIIVDQNGDWTETVALDRGSWNALKNKWMRCRIERFDGER